MMRGAVKWITRLICYGRSDIILPNPIPSTDDKFKFINDVYPIMWVGVEEMQIIVDFGYYKQTYQWSEIATVPVMEFPGYVTWTIKSVSR